MSNTILKFENISKQYRLGLVGTGTISHDLNRWWHKLRGKDDPYLKIGEVNDRSKKGESQYVWALKDINFEIERGEVVGIIGKNGAGKSTILKILSRVTSPTTGTIKTKGRIASLLEVGTGFHPELTGRENIFLNGAILGMTKAEITSKLDEIVDFSGCERYIDTPVKRYSSGMTVRLAFAVAAHLESEVLVVDEVLAVGDAEFQKKCIGKMKDVSKNEGRTVLFVSHNMASVKSLCEKGILLENGLVTCIEQIEKVISAYVDQNADLNNQWKVINEKRSSVYFEEVAIRVSGSQPNLELEIEGLLRVNSQFEESFLSFDISDSKGFPIMQAIPVESPFLDYRPCERILTKTIVKLPPLVPGIYHLSCWIGSDHRNTTDWVRQIAAFEVSDLPSKDRTIPYYSDHCGFLVPRSSITVEYLET